MLKKITLNEIKVGEALPWSAYDEEGRLLLSEGNVVPSQRILAALMEHGLYRITTANDIPPLGHKTQDKNDPFALLNECAESLHEIFNAIDEKEVDVGLRVKQLVKGFIQIVHKFPDAALGAVHLVGETNYSLWHPISVAILCELVAKRLQVPDAERFAMLATAFTSNVGMRRLQQELINQSEPLTDQQKKKLHAHPAKSAEMLMETGIVNVDWLRAVFQHHERIDGSGYPEGITGSEISRAAKLVAIADRYAAMVRGCTYRSAFHGKDTLRELLVENGKFYDQELSLVMISELGIYPSGSIVQLRSGEVGMVINRGRKNATIPHVASFIGPRGALMESPVLRNCAVTGYNIRDKFRLEGELPFSLISLWNAGYAKSEQTSQAG